MTEGVALVIGISVPAVLNVAVGFIAWSGKRNVKNQDDRLAALDAKLDDKLSGLDDKLGAIATDVRQLSSTVGSHEARLAQGGEKFNQLERRVDGIELRERERGCFGACRVGKAA